MPLQQVQAPAVKPEIAAATEDILRTARIADPGLRQQYASMLNNILSQEYAGFRGTERDSLKRLSVIKNRIVESMIRSDSMGGYLSSLHEKTSGGKNTASFSEYFGAELQAPNREERRNIVLNLGEAGAEKLAVWLCTASAYSEKQSGGGSLYSSSSGAYAEGLFDFSEEKKKINPTLFENVKQSVLQRVYDIPSSDEFAAQRYFGMTLRGEEMEQNFKALIAGNVKLEGLTEQSQGELHEYVEKNLKLTKNTYLSIFREYAERGVVFTQEEQAAICFATSTLGIGNGVLFAGELAAKTHLAPEAANKATDKLSRAIQAGTPPSFSSQLGEWSLPESVGGGITFDLKIGKTTFQIKLDEEDLRELMLFGSMEKGISYGKGELKVILAESLIDGKISAYLAPGAENALAYFEANYSSYREGRGSIPKNALAFSLTGFRAFREGNILEGAWDISSKKRTELAARDAKERNTIENQAKNEIVKIIELMHNDIASAFHRTSEDMQMTAGGVLGYFTMFLNDTASGLTFGIGGGTGDELLEEYRGLSEKWVRMVEIYARMKGSETLGEMQRHATAYVDESAEFFAKLQSFQEKLEENKVEGIGDVVVKGCKAALNVWTASGVALLAIGGAALLTRQITSVGFRGTVKALVPHGSLRRVGTEFIRSSISKETLKNASLWSGGFGALDLYGQYRLNNEINRVREGNFDMIDSQIKRMEGLLPSASDEDGKLILERIGELKAIRDSRAGGIDLGNTAAIMLQAALTTVIFQAGAKAISAAYYSPVNSGSLNITDDIIKAGEDIASTRADFTPKTSPIYRVISSDLKNINDLGLTPNQVNGVVTLDKSFLWYHNLIDRKLGDAVLNIYFKSIQNTVKKYGATAILSGGDEVTIFLSKPGNSFGTRFIEADMDRICQSMCDDIAKEIALQLERIGVDSSSKLFKRMSGFESNSIVFSLETKGGSLTATRGGKSINVSTEISYAELAKTMQKLRGKNLKLMKKLNKRTPGGPLTSHNRELPEGSIVLEASMKLGNEGKSLFKETALINNKGLRQAVLGEVGPSVINQAGHPYFDFIQNLLGKNLADRLDALGIEVRLIGPMKYAFFRNGKAIGADDLQAIEKAFNSSKISVLKELGKDGNVFDDVLFDLRVRGKNGTTSLKTSRLSGEPKDGPKYAKVRLQMAELHQDDMLPAWVRTVDDFEFLIEYAEMNEKSLQMVKGVLAGDTHVRDDWIKWISTVNVDITGNY